MAYDIGVPDDDNFCRVYVDTHSCTEIMRINLCSTAQLENSLHYWPSGYLRLINEDSPDAIYNDEIAEWVNVVMADVDDDAVAFNDTGYVYLDIVKGIVVDMELVVRTIGRDRKLGITIPSTETANYIDL